MEFLQDRPVRSIWGVGRALAEKLEGDGLHTNGDLRRQAPADLIARYGQIGRRLFDLAHGRDSRAVDPGQGAKSISTETTFNEDVDDIEVLIGHLWRLGVKTSDRAKAKGLAGRTVTLKLKTADFRTLTRQTAMEEPTNLVDTLHGHGERMLRAIAGHGPFRLIGIGLSALCPAETRDRPAQLFDDGSEARARAEAATDQIRARFGKDAIQRGRALR